MFLVQTDWGSSGFTPHTPTSTGCSVLGIMGYSGAQNASSLQVPRKPVQSVMDLPLSPEKCHPPVELLQEGALRISYPAPLRSH